MAVNFLYHYQHTPMDSGFRTRPITRMAPRRSAYAPRLGRNIAVCLLVVAVVSTLATMVDSVDAEASPYTFKPIRSYRRIVVPKHEFYVWKDAPAYKNERLAYYQGVLRDRNVPEDHIKMLVAQIIQENGSLSESHTTGDNGCAVGILQYNACAHHHVSAKRFLEIYPEWNDWRYQLDRMADMVADRERIYDGNIRWIVIHHNHPACAKRRCTDTKAGYYADVSSRLSLLTL